MDGVSADFEQKAKATILDLGKSDSEVIEFASKHLSKDSSPGERITIEQLMEARGRAESSLSQVLKALAEAARAVINNIRP